MNPVHRVGTVVMFAVCLGGLSACSGVLMNTPVSKRAEGWSLTLSQVKEGPDTYPAGGLAAGPGNGERFIWALVTVRNEGSEDQTFSYDSCNLDAKGKTYPPMIIDRPHEEADLGAAVERAEDFAPATERTRNLIFAYPDDQRPTRLKCGAISIAIPAKK